MWHVHPRYGEAALFVCELGAAVTEARAIEQQSQTMSNIYHVLSYVDAIKVWYCKRRCFRFSSSWQRLNFAKQSKCTDNLRQPREVARSFSSQILPNYSCGLKPPDPCPLLRHLPNGRWPMVWSLLTSTHTDSCVNVQENPTLKVCSLLLLNSAKITWDAEVGSSIEWVVWWSRVHICAPTCPCLQNKVKTFRNLAQLANGFT